MRRPKSPTAFIILFAILFVAVGTVVYLTARARSAWKSFPQMLSSVVSEYVDGKFSVGKVDISPTGLVFHDIKLTSDEAGEKQFFDADTVKVGMRLVDLVRNRKDPIQLVKSVEIIRPTAFIERGPDGRWNIAGLIKPGGQTQPKFSGRVTIKDGAVTLLDRAQVGKSHKNELKAVNVVVDFSDPSVADLRLTAKGPIGRMDKISVKGKYDLERKSISADVDGLGADATYWTKYPFNLKFMSASSGRADVRVHIGRAGDHKPILYNGEFLVSDAAVKFGWIRKPVTNADGTVKIKNDEVALALRARVGSTPVEVSGRVIGFKNSKLAIDVRTDRANIRELSRIIGVSVPKVIVLPTTGRALASISGPTKKISAVFKADVPTFAYSQFAAKNLHIEGTYASKRVVLRSVTGQAYGGPINASGEFIWGGKRNGLSLHGGISSVRVSQVPLAKGKGVDAITSGHFGIEWGSSGGVVSYRGTLTGGTYQRYKFDNGVLAISYRGDKVHLDEVSAEMFGGKVTASGDVSPKGDFDLDVSGAGINLASVQELLWKYPTVGNLQFDGKLTGTADSPTFDGVAEAYRVMVKGVSIEHASADMVASRKQVHLRELAIEDPSGKVTVSGDITNPLNVYPRLDLAVGVDGFDIERWAVSAGLPFVVTGALSADLKVTQTLFNPDVQGELSLKNGRVADLPVDSMQMQAAYHSRKLTISGLEAHSGSGVITADGGVGLNDGNLGLTFDARNMPISDLTSSVKDYVLLSGDLNVHGEVSGTVADTVMQASIGSDNPKVNGQSFGKLEADASWADGKLRIGKVALTDDKTEYSVSDLTYSPEDQKVELSGHVKDALIERLIALVGKGPKGGATAPLRGYLQSVPRPCCGVLGVTVSGGISLADDRIAPDMHFKGDISEATVGLSSISSLGFEGDWQGRTVRLSKIEALDGSTDVVASAVFGPRKAIDLRVDAHGVDLASVGKWFKLDQNFSGSADVTVIAGGTMSAPSIEASLDIQNPVFAGMKFDGLRARASAEPLGEGGSAGNRINIDDLTVVLGDSQLRASGYIPIDWSTYTIPRDKQLLVEMLFDDDSLKLLSSFAGGMLVGDAGGSITGKVSYGGTIEHPQLEGGLKWRDGHVQLARLEKPFEQIEADISLSGNTLSIDRLSGESAEGGTFSLSGPVDLSSLKPKLDLDLSTSELKVSGSNISGKYGETVTAVLNSAIRITGDWRTPLIAGDATIVKGTVGLGGSTDQATPTTASPLDPRFDLKVTIERGLQFKSARLQAALPGTLTLSGSLSEPAVDALINLADGTIAFPLQVFRLMPGSDMRLRMSPGQQPVVILDVKARGKVVDVSPLGKRTKYDVVMEASGPLDKLHPTFTSSPVGLSDQRIIALVTGQYQFEQILKGSQGQDIGKELSGLFSTAVMPTVFAPIESAFEQALGVDEFALEMGYQEPMQLSIGDQLGRNAYISYSAALGARPDYADSRYQLKLSYRIKNNLEIGVQTDENREFGITAEGKIRF